MAAPFDPDAYLKARQSFDPDKYLATQTPATPQVGAGETFLGRATDAIPLGSVLVNALTALRMRDKGERSRLTPEARAELEAMGEQEVRAPEPEGLVDTYRTVRDTRRERTAAGSEQNPTAAKLGTATGIGASVLAPLPKVSVGGGLGGRLGSAALTGAAYGAVEGLEHGDADLTRGEFRKGAEEATKGALLGGAGGLVAGGVAEGASRVLPGVLRRLSIQQGKQAIQGGSDIAAATREPLSDAAVEEVLASRGIRSLDTTPTIYKRIQDLVNEQGGTYNNLISELEGLGVQGPRAQEVADELLRRGASLERNTLNEALPAEYLRRAELVSGKADEGGTLGLTQAENLKRSAQDMARYGKVEETPLNEVRRDVASVLRKANEDAITEAAMVPGVAPRVQELSGQFVPVKQRLGRLLEAEKFAQKGAAKAEQRSSVGLKDMMVGASAGNPLAAAPVALLSSLARNRLPATVATESYALANALRSGRAGANLARGVDGGLSEGAEVAQDFADASADDPTLSPVVAALLRALRRKKKE